MDKRHLELLGVGILALMVLVLAVLGFMVWQQSNETKDGTLKQPQSLHQYATLEEYNNSINRSCTENNDCVVKDVRNCCGYYPSCVNKDASIDHAFVEWACAEEGLASICGFIEIESCECANNTCQAVTGMVQ
jgi:Tfp pilus assembly protein PilV